MRRGLIVVLIALGIAPVFAEENVATKSEAEVRDFFLQVVGTYLAEPPAPTFNHSPTVFTLDNGENIPAEKLANAWPELAREAFKPGKTLADYQRCMGIESRDPRKDKRFMATMHRYTSYEYAAGDLLLDGRTPKQDRESVIKYEKAFFFLVRKVDGKWIVLAIGG